MSEERALVILITEDGIIENRIIKTPKGLQIHYLMKQLIILIL